MSQNIACRCDIIFQIILYLAYNGQRKTPFHPSLPKSVHEICRSKSLIQTMNRLSLGISCTKLERININMAQGTIETAAENPVMIHDAMDNLEKKTSVISGSHDRIQNNVSK